jgi:hypothetical protein
MEQFTPRQQRAEIGWHVTVGKKPVTIWLKPPADREQARRVAEFLESTVEEIEVISTGTGTDGSE